MYKQFVPQQQSFIRKMKEKNAQALESFNVCARSEILQHNYMSAPTSNVSYPAGLCMPKGDKPTMFYAQGKPAMSYKCAK